MGLLIAIKFVLARIYPKVIKGLKWVGNAINRLGKVILAFFYPFKNVLKTYKEV